MSKMTKEFKDFIMQGNVLMVAVGLIMALTFGKIIDAFVKGVITPIIGAIFNVSVADMVIKIGAAKIEYGLVIDATITFLITAAVLFAIVKSYNKFTTQADAPPTEIDLLTEIRDSLAKR